jgi:hypothetical protein
VRKDSLVASDHWETDGGSNMFLSHGPCATLPVSKQSIQEQHTRHALVKQTRQQKLQSKGSRGSAGTEKQANVFDGNPRQTNKD